MGPQFSLTGACRLHDSEDIINFLEWMSIAIPYMIELTKRERKIFDEVMEQIGRTVVLLSGLSYEEWLDQLREHQYLTLSTLSGKSAGKSILSAPVSERGPQQPQMKKSTVYTQQKSCFKALNLRQVWYCIDACNLYQFRLWIVTSSNNQQNSG